MTTTPVVVSVSLLEMRNSGGNLCDGDGNEAPNFSDGKEAADETKDFVEEHEGGGGGGKSSPGSHDQPLGDNDSNNGAPSYDDVKQYYEPVGDDANEEGGGVMDDHHVKQQLEKMEEIENGEGGGGSEPQGGGDDHKDGVADDRKLADGIKIDYEGGRGIDSYTTTILFTVGMMFEFMKVTMKNKESRLIR